jgi:hypothetical protein
MSKASAKQNQSKGESKEKLKQCKAKLTQI